MNRATTQPETLDLAIVGGGPAGMSAALIAGRALLSAVVVNAEAPRNAATRASHGFLTRDGAHPLELLEIGKRQLERYDTVAYVADRVVGVEATDASFVVTAASGAAYAAHRVLFATGLRDRIDRLGIPGLEAVYGTSVFPCPFCDGWEHRDLPLALFGRGAWIGAFAKTIRHWSRDLVLFTDGDTTLPTDTRAALERRGVRIETGEIAQLDHVDGELRAVVLESARRVERRAGFLLDTGEERATDLPVKLGVAPSEDGTYEADENGKTGVAGVYVVGDGRTGFGGLIAAAAEGARAAEGIVHEVIEERWQSEAR